MNFPNFIMLGVCSFLAFETKGSHFFPQSPLTESYTYFWVKTETIYHDHVAR